MQVLLEDLEKGYMVVKLSTAEKFETLQKMGNILVEKGFAKKSFIEAVQEREKVFPTGLPLETFGVAIPHTGSIHVKRRGILCGILENPNEFVVMATEDEKVMCCLAFMLALEQPHEQLEMLAKLMEVCQNTDELQILKDAENIEAIKEIMDALMV